MANAEPSPQMSRLARRLRELREREFTRLRPFALSAMLAVLIGSLGSPLGGKNSPDGVNEARDIPPETFTEHHAWLRFQ